MLLIKLRKSANWSFVVALLLISTALNTQSQTTTGVILGTVLDSSGAVIPGVAIQITNEETGAVQNTVIKCQTHIQAALLIEQAVMQRRCQDRYEIQNASALPGCSTPLGKGREAVRRM